MGASPLMSLGIRAMQANYAALQTTGHNIANANVAGYSRQEIALATTPGQYTGAGFFGRGVDVVTVSRSHNEFLTRESSASASLSAMDAARLSQLKRLENIFKPGESGLGNAATELFNSMVDLSNAPNDLSSRQVVLARAGDMAARFSEAGTALDQLQFGVTADLKANVAEINSLAKSIAAVNQRIAALRGLGQPANDVLDERERLVQSLSERVQLTRIEADDGTMAIFIGGGQRLVLGAEPAEVKVVQDPADPSRSAVGIVEGNGVRTLDAATLGAGSVAGLLRFQNEDLAAGRNLIGQMAVAIGSALNEQQLAGMNLQPPLGQVPSSPLFAMGAPQALPNASNSKDGNGTPWGNVQLTITDASQLQPSDYDLRQSTTNPGMWQLTRLSDGRVSQVNSGDTVDGLRIDINDAYDGDRFLLQPVARGANGMKLLLNDGRDLAAASPLLPSIASTNTGTAAVNSFSTTSSPAPVRDATTRISFTNDSGDYTWELTDSGGSLLGSGSGTWRAGDPMPPAAADINGFQMQLSGVPRSGDVITVAPTPAGALVNNNGNALALMALRDKALAAGSTINEAWSEALAEVGVRTQSAQTASGISASVAAQAELSRTAQSGVNLDEEAARLIHYQQSYQAAAKVLQVAQAIFDTLLQTAGR